MRFRSRSPLIRFICASMTVGVLASCERGPTAADVQGEYRRPSVITPSSPSLAYTPIGTFSVGGVNASGSTTDRSTPGPTLPNKRLLYRVSAAGTVTASRTAYWYDGPTTPAEGAYGPSGYAGSGPNGPTCYAFVYVGSTSTYGGEPWFAPSCLGGTPPLPNSASGHVYLAGATSINRFSSSGGGQWDCSAPIIGYGPCFSWVDDGQTVTIDRVDATFDLLAAPTSVNYGDTVTVTASISPGTVEGKDVPWTIDSTRWVPAFGTQTAPCAWNHFVPNNTGPTRTCRKPFTRSGTLTVFATVNGTAQSKAVSVIVTPPQLTVTATPSSVVNSGSVTFVASLTPTNISWSLSSWTWRPDSGSGGIDPYGCGWTEKTCVRTIRKTGWQVASASLDGYSLKDSARVVCVTAKCAANDSLLGDSLRFRQRLIDMIQRAGIYNSNRSARREIKVYVFRDTTTGTLSFVEPPQTATPCRVTSSVPSPPSNSRLVAVAHAEPFWPEYGGNPPDEAPAGCGPGWYSNRPSGGDWRSNEGVPEYMINGRFVFKYDPSDPRASNPQNWPSLTRSFDWNTDSCRW